MANVKNWQRRVHKILDSQFQNPKFNNEKLATELGISKRHLFREMKKITDLTPQKYIRCYRLQKAIDLLKSGQVQTVREASYFIGYRNISYFIMQFKKQFGKTPFQVLQQNR